MQKIEKRCGKNLATESTFEVMSSSVGMPAEMPKALSFEC